MRMVSSNVNPIIALVGVQQTRVMVLLTLTWVLAHRQSKADAIEKMSPSLAVDAQ